MLIVNGATGSLGSSIIAHSQKIGIQVVGLGRNRAKLDALSSRHPSVKFIALSDITSEEEAVRVLNSLRDISQATTLSYVHAAAGLTRTSSPLDTSLENFRETIETNLVGAFVWNKAVMGLMVSESKEGSIINVSSQAARTGGYGGTTSYAASKGGLVTLTKTFARYGANFNIRVNSISPGFIDNEMMTQGLSNDDVSKFSEKTALKRLATNDEVANLIMYLTSSESSYITGENIEISGGLSLG